jgi:hypothetical protein
VKSSPCLIVAAFLILFRSLAPNSVCFAQSPSTQPATSSSEKIDLQINPIDVPSPSPSMSQQFVIPGFAVQFLGTIAGWLYTEVIGKPLDNYLSTFDATFSDKKVCDFGGFNPHGYYCKLTRTVGTADAFSYDFLVTPSIGGKSVRIIPRSLTDEIQKAKKGRISSVVATVSLRVVTSGSVQTLNYAIDPVQMKYEKKGQSERAVPNYLNDKLKALEIPKPSENGHVGLELPKQMISLKGSDWFPAPEDGAFTMEVKIAESNQTADKIKKAIDSLKIPDAVPKAVSDLFPSSSKSSGGKTSGQ